MAEKQGLIIAGPTASGKSAYAFELAQKENGVIINADSLQLYEGLPLLTAQPSSEEMKCIPHFLYSHLPAETPLCSAGEWGRMVRSVIETIHQEGRRPLVVGGSGFYLSVLTSGLSPIPSVAPEILGEFREISTAELYAELHTVDPTCAQRLQHKDRQRIVRALSVWRATNKPLSVWQTKPRIPFPYSFQVKLFLPERQQLWRQIEERLRKMLAEGVLEEVRRFMERLGPEGVSRSPLSRAIGFQAIRGYWEGTLTRAQTIQQLLEKTRQYAKRQTTWFRHQGDY